MAATQKQELTGVQRILGDHLAVRMAKRLRVPEACVRFDEEDSQLEWYTSTMRERMIGLWPVRWEGPEPFVDTWCEFENFLAIAREATQDFRDELRR